MIWIIGGTRETRKLVDRIRDIDNYIVTIATDSGREFINTPNLIVGRMNYEEMLRFIDEKGISLIVDLSHPYAKVVTQNAKKAAEYKDIKYIRYIREKTTLETKSIYLNSHEECYNYLTKVKGIVFFTTGSKNIGDFEKVRGNNRFIYRILPAIESIKECKKYGISLKDIVAVLGPFSKDYNKIMFKEYTVDYVVMKDSGREGGTVEKVLACKELGITSIIIGREEEQGLSNMDSIEKIIRGI